MHRSALIGLLVLGGTCSPALADGSGGTVAPGDTISTGKAGGLTVGAGTAPRAHLFARHAAGRPRIRVRFEEPGVTSVVARLVVLRSPDNSVVAEVALGRVRTGRPITVPWRHGRLPEGRYVVRVHARDRWNHQLVRTGRATGKATLVVHGAPPSSPPPPPATTSSTGVFPIAGPFTYGDGLGAGRGHQGQDMAAAAGTPIVAPVDGTVASVAFQKSAAGQYVVLNGVDGRSFFFAHAQKGSPTVVAGQAVTAGTVLALVGSTGRSTGPHLHFEIWVNGWRVSKKSRPIDPLPQLRAWAS